MEFIVLYKLYIIRHFIITLLMIFSLFRSCISAELALLSSQLDTLAQQRHQAEQKVRAIDWSKIPCLTHGINILAPTGTTASHPSVIFKENETPLGITVEIVQPIVVWQEFVCGDIISSSLATAQKLLADGFPAGSHAQFIKIFKDYFLGLESYKILLSKMPNGQLGGGQASCGYHAIAHAQTVVNYLLDTKGNDLSNLLNFKYVNDLFGVAMIRIILSNKQADGLWRTLIKNLQKAQREDPQKAANPDNKEQMWLRELQKYFPGNDYSMLQRYVAPSLAAWNGDWLETNGLTILIKDIKRQYHNFVEWNEGIIGNFRDQKDYLGEKFAIISSRKAVNFVSVIIYHAGVTVSEQDLKSSGREKHAHWLSIIFSKSDNKLQIIVLDSKNMPRLDDEVIHHLIIAITQLSSAQLKKYLTISKEDAKIFTDMKLTSEYASFRDNGTTLGGANEFRQKDRQPLISPQQWYQAGPLNLCLESEIKKLGYNIIIRELLLKGENSKKQINAYFQNINLPPPSQQNINNGIRAFQTETGQLITVT